MAKRSRNFTGKTQKLALARQTNLCASCGTPISALGDEGREKHKFGEGAHAHHIQHVKLGGTNNLENCVVLCWSCHYSVHEGGNFRRGTASGAPEDFPYFNGMTI